MVGEVLIVAQLMVRVDYYQACSDQAGGKPKNIQTIKELVFQEIPDRQVQEDFDHRSFFNEGTLCKSPGGLMWS